MCSMGFFHWVLSNLGIQFEKRSCLMTFYHWLSCIETFFRMLDQMPSREKLSCLPLFFSKPIIAMGKGHYNWQRATSIICCVGYVWLGSYLPSYKTSQFSLEWHFRKIIQKIPQMILQCTRATFVLNPTF